MYYDFCSNSQLAPAIPQASDHTRVIFFTELSAFYMLGAFSRDNESLLRTTRYGNIIQTMLMSDRDNHTNNALVLYTYLLHERNATITGQLLHMHRNNVIYHIGKLQEQMNIELDDPRIRLNLLVLFTALGMNN